MKKNLFYVMSLAAVFSLGSCSQEDLADVKQEDVVKLGIASTSIGQSSRAIVETAYLPDKSEIGVFLKESSAATYAGKTYANIKYTASGTITQSWSSSNAPQLKKTTGNVYAYYPYKAGASDITKIPVEGVDDFMYTKQPASASYDSPSATLTMDHLFTVFNVTFKKGETYTGECILSEVEITSAYNKGTFNLTTGKFTPDTSNVLENTEEYDFSEDDVTVTLIGCIPSNEDPYLYFTIDSDNDDSGQGGWDIGESQSPKAGYIYDILVTVEGTARNVSLTKVTVNTWESGSYDYNWNYED